MKGKGAKVAQQMSLPQIVKEVRESVSVHLTEEGVEGLKRTPYVRDGAYLACRRVIDDENRHYLRLEVRYYAKDSKLPQHAFLSIPHFYVKYMVAENQF